MVPRFTKQAWLALPIFLLAACAAVSLPSWSRVIHGVDLDFDSQNFDYYKRLFSDLTNGKATDEERVGTVNKFIATRFVHHQEEGMSPTPRTVIESGSQYSENLALAMATITRAGNYNVRILHLSNGPTPLDTHAVVEVYYEGGWHLYDPTYGAAFHNKAGTIASYREIRLNTDLLADVNAGGDASRFSPNSLRKIYGEGPRHFYCFSSDCTQ